MLLSPTRSFISVCFQLVNGNGKKKCYHHHLFKRTLIEIYMKKHACIAAHSI